MNSGGLTWRAACASDLPAMLAIEQTAYAHPWSMANFQESLASGYRIQVLTRDEVAGPAGRGFIGYSVVLRGVDEAHLLNITVAPDHQRRGFGPLLLGELCDWSGDQGLHWLWLEVRASNHRALAVYERFGLSRVGQRKGYYPASRGEREDAVVMSASITQLIANRVATEATS